MAKGWKIPQNRNCWLATTNKSHEPAATRTLALSSFICVRARTRAAKRHQDGGAQWTRRGKQTTDSVLAPSRSLEHSWVHQRHRFLHQMKAMWMFGVLTGKYLWSFVGLQSFRGCSKRWEGERWNYHGRGDDFYDVVDVARAMICACNLNVVKSNFRWTFKHK